MPSLVDARQIFMVLLALTATCPCSIAQEGRNSEVVALIQVKSNLQDTQGSLKGWDLNAMDPCNWAHIGCDSSGNFVTRLDLPSQQLSGSLSPWIGNLSNLEYLTLQKNNFFGPIPPEVGNLTKLQYLDFSNNSFSGSIPPTLSQLTSLTQLDLSFNNLSGPVPKLSFTNFNIQGNLLLCGYPLNQACPGEPPAPTGSTSPVLMTGKSTRKSHKGIMVCGLSVGATLLIASISCGIAWWKRHDRKQIFFDVNEQESPHMSLGQLKKFSFRELQIATDNFSSRNILGRGGFGNVYKGCLGDGSLVAVKRLREDGTAGGELQFQMEVEMISLAVHRNLLRLRGFCMTPTERLLVYPYMSNGSVASRLRDTLFGKPALDWSTRKRIALGAGRGLLYLHEHCDPKIIHRDVKAANVLLDDDFEAVVGDFGLAKLLDHQDSHVTTAVRGTVGHIAPEYLSTGQSSEKTDVFGFGILLLELITGQRAFDFGRISSNKDVMLLDWVKKLQHEKRLDLLVDVDLKLKYNAVELEEMVQVALLCTQLSPTDRPKMGEVVRMLEGDGLAERWEAWRRVENRRSQDAVSMPRKYYELVEDSTFDLEAIQLSGPR